MSCETGSDAHGSDGHQASAQAAGRPAERFAKSGGHASKNPTLPVLKRLAKAIGVPVTALLE